MSKPISEFRVPIRTGADIVLARQMGRELALQTGFSGSEPVCIAAVISEVARSLLDHAQRGEIYLAINREDSRHYISVIARDEGPGHSNFEHATQFADAARLGSGVALSRAKLLMDEFQVWPGSGNGTNITMRKWVN